MNNQHQGPNGYKTPKSHISKMSSNNESGTSIEDIKNLIMSVSQSIAEVGNKADANIASINVKLNDSTNVMEKYLNDIKEAFGVVIARVDIVENKAN